MFPNQLPFTGSAYSHERTETQNNFSNTESVLDDQKQIDDMISLILLFLGTVIFTTSGLYLNCTNDFNSLMACHFDAENCTEHKITLKNSDETVTCAFGLCVRGCCCSMQIVPILGETFRAHVFKAGQSVHSQTIDIRETIKPQTPTIVSVEYSNGLYQIKWKTNSKSALLPLLKATVTYQKEGENKTISETVQELSTDMNNYEILGHNLEPSAMYVVSVKTYTNYGVFSDSSNQMEFKTASSPNGVLIAVILFLSIIAVIVSGVAFVSFIKLKGNLWDKAAKDEKPKFLDIKPKKAEFLMPESLSVYSLSVEPLVPKDSRTLSEESLEDSSVRSGQSSGISTGLSSDSYANTEPINMEASVIEALKKLMPITSPVQTLGPTGLQDSSSVVPLAVTKISPVEFVNKTYTSANISNQDITEMQATSDSGYHSSEGPPLQDFILLPAHIETDMSYQPCKSEDDKLLLTSSGISSGLDLLPVVYGYQDFETLVEQPNKSEGEDFRMKLELSNSVMTDPNEISVDFGYHCV